MGSKITKGGTVAAPTYVETATTISDILIGAVMAPLNAFNTKNVEFVDIGTAGRQAVAMGALAFFLGDRYGDSVPILGMGR